MRGPISDSYGGPMDKKPAPPRWAFPHLSDEEFKEMVGQMRCAERINARIDAEARKPEDASRGE